MIFFNNFKLSLMHCSLIYLHFPWFVPFPFFKGCHRIIWAFLFRWTALLNIRSHTHFILFNLLEQSICRLNWFFLFSPSPSPSFRLAIKGILSSFGFLFLDKQRAGSKWFNAIFTHLQRTWLTRAMAELRGNQAATARPLSAHMQEASYSS